MPGIRPDEQIAFWAINGKIYKAERDQTVPSIKKWMEKCVKSVD